MGNMNTLTDVNFDLGFYNTFEERQANTYSDGQSLAESHTHEQYDEVATFRNRSLQNERECLRFKKKGDRTAHDHEMTPLDYETVCQRPDEHQRSKKISTNHNLNVFDDDIYSTTQSDSISGGQEVQMGEKYTKETISDELYADKHSLHSLHDTNIEHEYAEPQVVNRMQSNTDGQTKHVEGHHYHCLEGNDEQIISTCVSDASIESQIKYTEKVIHKMCDDTKVEKIFDDPTYA